MIGCFHHPRTRLANRASPSLTAPNSGRSRAFDHACLVFTFDAWVEYVDRNSVYSLDRAWFRWIKLGKLLVGSLAVAGVFSSCADREHKLVISVPEQRMVLLKNGVPLAVYPVSTSKFGLGDGPGTRATPLGELEIARKIGDGAPLGAVFKSREQTGEVLVPDAPGRDPIVTRILWLRGLEAGNSNAYERYIYIHGTPEERRIGQPASFGCVRMRSRDVVQLYNEVGKGAKVFIRDEPLALASTPYLVAGAVIPAPSPAVAPVKALSYLADSPLDNR